MIVTSRKILGFREVSRAICNFGLRNHGADVTFEWQTVVGAVLQDDQTGNRPQEQTRPYQSIDLLKEPFK